LTTDQVFFVLDNMRKICGSWVEYGLYLEALNENELRSAAQDALKKPPLAVIEPKKTVSVKLQESLAREVGAPVFDLILIDEETTVDDIHYEYYHGIGSQNSTGDLINLLVAQNEDGLLSDSQYKAWFTHRSLMLEERECIIHAFYMLRKSDSSLSTEDVLSIFKWRQGSYDCLSLFTTF
jgi:hypothetical protein